MTTDKIIRQILNLLNRNEKKGATKYEAENALNLANKLMTEYNISELDLKKVDRSSFIDKSVKMLRLDMAKLFSQLAQAFDCEHYYYKLKKEFHFFGFELDVKICIHFAEMLTAVLIQDLKRYKKSDEYKQLIEVYQGKMIMRNFVEGFTQKLSIRLHEMQKEKQKAILSSGTSLMVIKKQQVTDEFNKLHNNVKISKDSFSFIKSAFLQGEMNANNVQFNKPIENISNELLQIGSRR